MEKLDIINYTGYINVPTIINRITTGLLKVYIFSIYYSYMSGFDKLIYKRKAISHKFKLLDTSFLQNYPIVYNNREMR